MHDQHATSGVYRRVTPAVLGCETGRVDELIHWFHQQLDAGERVAREADPEPTVEPSGGLVRSLVDRDTPPPGLLGCRFTDVARVFLMPAHV
jgi:hypothetical protein